MKSPRLKTSAEKNKFSPQELANLQTQLVFTNNLDLEEVMWNSDFIVQSSKWCKLDKDNSLVEAQVGEIEDDPQLMEIKFRNYKGDLMSFVTGNEEQILSLSDLKSSKNKNKIKKLATQFSAKETGLKEVELDEETSAILRKDFSPAGDYSLQVSIAKYLPLKKSSNKKKVKAAKNKIISAVTQDINEAYYDKAALTRSEFNQKMKDWIEGAKDLEVEEE